MLGPGPLGAAVADIPPATTSATAATEAAGRRIEPMPLTSHGNVICFPADVSSLRARIASLPSPEGCPERRSPTASGKCDRRPQASRRLGTFPRGGPAPPVERLRWCGGGAKHEATWEVGSGLLALAGCSAACLALGGCSSGSSRSSRSGSSSSSSSSSGISYADVVQVTGTATRSRSGGITWKSEASDPRVSGDRTANPECADDRGRPAERSLFLRRRRTRSRTIGVRGKAGAPGR